MLRKSVQRSWSFVVIGLIAGLLGACTKNKPDAPPPSEQHEVAVLKLTGIRPDSGQNDQSMKISLSGSGFKAGAKVMLGDNLLPDVSVPFPDNIRVTVPAGLEVGSYNVTVRNPDGKEAVLPDAFSVVLPRGSMAGGHRADCKPENVYFDFDNSSLAPAARRALQANVECIQARGGRRIEVHGHTDDRGSTEYNLALGQRRADEVRRYLRQLGISNIKTISYGEERPVDYGHTESAWARNRRAETNILE